MKLQKVRKALLLLILGTVPLGTVSTCDYADGVGSFFYDHGGGGAVIVPAHVPHDDVIIVDEQVIEEDVIIEDVYYDDCGFWDSCYWGW
jgi:hypothetical protein